MLNKSTEAAIAAMSLLAERFDGCESLVRAEEIAEKRRLQRPFVAKLLTQLSQAGLTKGTPGRRGGYCLGRSPEEITLADIAACFERREPTLPCPFGMHHCGNGPNCPLHDDIVDLKERTDTFLKKTTLAVFASAHPQADDAPPDSA